MSRNFADTILYNANILTMEDDLPRAEAVCIRAGSIVFVGSNEAAMKWRDNETDVIDLDGKTVIPGIIESHCHPFTHGDMLTGIPCGGENTKSLTALMNAVKAFADKAPHGAWLKGRGWDNYKMSGEARFPNRYDLDQVSPNNPVCLTRACAHVSVANSMALSLAHITRDTPDPGNGVIERDADGEPTGILREGARGLLPIPPAGLEDAKNAYRTVQALYLSEGITCADNMSAVSGDVRAAQELLDAGEMKLRLRNWYHARDVLVNKGVLDSMLDVGIRKSFGPSMMKFQGMKFMLDGGFGARTAAVTAPYVGEPENHGLLYYKPDDVIADIVRACKAGFQVCIHAIGDAAIQVCLDGFEAASQAGVDMRALRCRIEHCDIPTPAQIERIAALNVVPSSSTTHIYYSGKTMRDCLEPAICNSMFPHKTYQTMGIRSSCNSDAPVAPCSPMVGLYSMVTRCYPGGDMGAAECISPLEALKCFTINAAYANHEEDSLGSIKADKLADLAVLSADPCTVDSQEILGIQTILTMVDGKIVFRR